MRRVSVFGSTGSIGVNTVDLLTQGDYDVVALTGGRNVALLAQQAKALNAQIAVTAFDDCLADLQSALAGTRIEAAAGETAIIDAAARPCDWTMSAIIGAAGLKPGLTALQHGGTLALANKESLVAAGPLMLATAKTQNAMILPVDSEHSAVFQALVGEDIAQVERIIITASGGAFRDWPTERLATATPDQAAQHPNWDMGQRITIDSASLFNKAMELIETKEYFGVNADQVETVIHPESLVHALVGFKDGALMAHLGPPDMRHAIGYALHWPNRAALPVARLDLAQIGALTFRAADPIRHPALRIARDVMQIGGLAGAVFNAAKEAALDAFIARKIGFMQMADLVDAVLNRMELENGLSCDTLTLDTVMDADRVARRHAASMIGNLSVK